MADFSEKWGTDVETAIKLALDDLRLTIDEVDVTVLEEPSRGFFGIGSNLALVRVEKKNLRRRAQQRKKTSIKKKKRQLSKKQKRLRLKKQKHLKKNISKKKK